MAVLGLQRAAVAFALCDHIAALNYSGTLEHSLNCFEHILNPLASAGNAGA